MSDQEAREWVALALLAGGLVLYLLVDAMVPTQVRIGSATFGDSQGECHGISRQGGTDVVLEFCK